MGVARFFYRPVLEWAPLVTLLIADSVDIFINPWFTDAPPFFMGLALYFWLIYRPKHVYLGALALQGLIHDLFVGDPLGFFALMMMAGALAVSCFRFLLVGRSFLISWLGCAVMFFSLMLFKYAYAFIWFKPPLPLLATSLSVSVSLALYPLAAMMLGKMLPLMGQAKG